VFQTSGAEVVGSLATKVGTVDEVEITFDFMLIVGEVGGAAPKSGVLPVWAKTEF
jgi:sporulation protein YlmC with PRC-barrel domain